MIRLRAPAALNRLARTRANESRPERHQAWTPLQSRGDQSRPAMAAMAGRAKQMGSPPTNLVTSSEFAPVPPLVHKRGAKVSPPLTARKTARAGTPLTRWASSGIFWCHQRWPVPKKIRLCMRKEVPTPGAPRQLYGCKLRHTVDGYGGTPVAQASPTEQPLLSIRRAVSAGQSASRVSDARTDSAEAAGAFSQAAGGKRRAADWQKRTGGLANGIADHFPSHQSLAGYGVGLDRLSGLTNHEP
jgi:hypothetical protein